MKRSSAPEEEGPEYNEEDGEGCSADSGADDGGEGHLGGHI